MLALAPELPAAPSPPSLHESPPLPLTAARATAYRQLSHGLPPDDPRSRLAGDDRALPLGPGRGGDTPGGRHGDGRRRRRGPGRVRGQPPHALVRRRGADARPRGRDRRGPRGERPHDLAARPHPRALPGGRPRRPARRPPARLGRPGHPPRALHRARPLGDADVRRGGRAGPRPSPARLPDAPGAPRPRREPLDRGRGGEVPHPLDLDGGPLPARRGASRGRHAPGQRRHGRHARRHDRGRAAGERQPCRRARGGARRVLSRRAGGDHRPIRAGAGRRPRQGGPGSVRDADRDAPASRVRGAHRPQVPPLEHGRGAAPDAGAARPGPARADGPQLGRLPPHHRRGAQARVRRPRALLRRPPARFRPDGGAPLGRLRRRPPGADRPRPGRRWRCAPAIREG